MKIIVVGTSNSVIGIEGFLQSLRLQHEVVQFSSGRTPFFCSLKTIINNKELIESCDLLILDHYINDMNFYRLKYGKEYDKLCDLFYKYLSSLNVDILNLLFPIKDIELRSTKPFYKWVKKLTFKYKLSCLDLNEYKFLPHHFKDQIHLNSNVSYALGIVLGNYLNFPLFNIKPHGGFCSSMPITIINLPDYDHVNESSSYENRLINIKYVDLNKSITLKRKNSDRLISLGYLKPKGIKGMSGIAINENYCYGFSDTGYFHEMIDSPIYGSLNISPLFGNYDIKNLMGRGRSKGDFCYCYLTELVFYDVNVEMFYRSAKRNVINFNLPNLIEVSERLSPKILKLTDKTIEKLRDTALSLENKDLAVAEQLMQLAHIARPLGPVIKTKLDQYRERLKIKN